MERQDAENLSPPNLTHPEPIPGAEQEQPTPNPSQEGNKTAGEQEQPTPSPSQEGKEYYVPPILTKTWYHTGAWLQQESLIQQYKKEYFAGDAQAYSMPDSDLNFHPSPGQNLDYQPDAQAKQEANRALKGAVLREEVYALDGNKTLEQNPYTVTETNYSVRMLQPSQGECSGVYFTHNRETLTYHYERNLQDPRVQHDFVLEVTDFGNVKKACSITYGRRNNSSIKVYPEQAALRATVQLGKFIEETTAFLLVGVPYEQQAWEINGLDLQGQRYFTWDTVSQQVNDALKRKIAYGVEFSSNVKQARLFAWEQSYFWNSTQGDVLPLGEITERGLLHHHQQAVFSKQWLEVVYGNKLKEEIISHQGGYFLEEGY